MRIDQRIPKSQILILMMKEYDYIVHGFFVLFSKIQFLLSLMNCDTEFYVYLFRMPLCNVLIEKLILDGILLR